MSTNSESKGKTDSLGRAAKSSRIDMAGLGPLVIELSGQHSYRDIALKLRTEHGVDVSYQTVAKYIKSHASENAEKTRAALNERLVKDIDTDVGGLDDLISFFRFMYNNEDVSDRDRISAADKCRAVYETKLKFSTGVGMGIEISGTLKFIRVEEQRRKDNTIDTTATVIRELDSENDSHFEVLE